MLNAIEQAPLSARELDEMAASHRADHALQNVPETRRAWIDSAATYCYQTHIAMTGQPLERLAWVSDVFYRAASLEAQPWYLQFLGGASQSLSAKPVGAVEKHQLCLGCFDLGVGQPRYYRQLVSLAMPNQSTQVIVARSVPDGPEAPKGNKCAYTLSPNGEVLYWEAGVLHWHHICCTPGAALFPPTIDRWFINALRRLGLDSAECSTYTAEANQLRDWLQSGAGPLDLQFR
ncbi:MAG: hypothetical protein AB8C02_14995 [Halioglobus sp.]